MNEATETVTIDGADLLGPLARLYDTMPAGSWIEIAKPKEAGPDGKPQMIVRRRIPGLIATAVSERMTTDQGAAVETRTALALATSLLAHVEGV